VLLQLLVLDPPLAEVHPPQEGDVAAHRPSLAKAYPALTSRFLKRSTAAAGF
jgi:hypothetical protein